MRAAAATAGGDNQEVVEEIYRAFGRGDVATVLERMAEDARWDFAVAGSDVPWHAPATGHAEIEGFLSTFVAHVTLTAFEPRRFIASGDEVIVDVRLTYLVKKTGRPVDLQQLHWWSLADGLVTRLRHFEDTAQVIFGLEGQPGLSGPAAATRVGRKRAPGAADPYWPVAVAAAALLIVAGVANSAVPRLARVVVGLSALVAMALRTRRLASARAELARRHAALRAREQQLQNMADAMPALISYVGRDRRYLFVNRQYETWFRRPVPEMTGKTVDEVLGPEAMQRAGRYIDQALRGERVAFELEAPYPGGPRWVNAQYLPDVDAAGHVAGFSVFVLDVTERKLAEEALRQSEARLRAVLDHLSVGVGLTDQEGRLLLSNATMRAYTPEWIPSRDSARIDRWRAVDAAGRPLPPERWPPRRALVGETVRPGIEFRFRGDDGADAWLLVSAVPLRTATGEATGAIVVVQDITAHKRANETLQAADRRKDEFIATLAHELRNPLAAIRNAAMILQNRGVTDADGQRMPEVIDRQLQHMSRLLEDLLDVSRLAHDKLTLRRQRLELAEIVRMAIETCRPQLDAAGHELTVALPDAPLWVHADPVRLAQVFANLISNAAKYTRSPGHLRIVAERRGDEVVVSVKDDGVGIPAEMLPHLFELFSQGERVPEQVQGGLGVGLALVRGLVHLHGGRVEAKSEGRDRGSEFLVRLPAVDGDAPLPVRPTPLAGGLAKGARLRVLIADDIPDNVNTLAMLVRMIGHEAQTAYDGEEALARAFELRPEVAILDLGMPKRTGIEVCRRIREQPWGQGMTLVAVTGWGREDDRRLTREAGFDHHLVKPVDPRVLLDLLSSLAARAGRNPER